MISQQVSRSTARSRWAFSVCIQYVSCHFRHLAYWLIVSGCVLQRSHSHHLQRVVKRCAMRWKQRALCKSQKGHKVQGGPLKKSVTFCPTTPASSSDSAERETEDGVLIKLWVWDRGPLWGCVQHVASDFFFSQDSSPYTSTTATPLWGTVRVSANSIVT